MPVQTATNATTWLSGVRATETHIAFRTYSKHDLDAAFSLGVEDPD